MSVDIQQRTLTLTPGLIIQLIFVVLIFPFSPLLISGKWDWWEAWVCASIFAVGFIISRLLAYQRHPDLLVERTQSMKKKDAKSWDKVLAPLLAVGSIFIPIVAGLEARGNDIVLFDLSIRLISLFFLIFGYAWSSYALIENRFFSGLVRIQEERNHHVVSTGPYRWMRHPGYAGLLLIYCATPFFLDSLWAFIPTIFFILVLILRTYLEDQTLRDELVGYKSYTQTVPARLLPGIW